jgi:alkylation response protein AidB-like acyl-CoA dehydrogenase
MQVERFYHNSRLTLIGDDPGEIQRLLIARQLLKEM